MRGEHEGRELRELGVEQELRAHGVPVLRVERRGGAVVAEGAERGDDESSQPTSSAAAPAATPEPRRARLVADIEPLSAPRGVPGAMSDLTDRAQQLGRQAEHSDWLDHVARVGLLAFGLVHLVVGWLAVQLAFGDREGSASTSGAIHELAQQPFGGVLVWLVAVGMYLLAAWQVIEALLGHRDQDGADRVRKRLTSAGKAVVYAVIATSALKVAIGEGSGGSEQATDSTTAKLMDLPAGQVLVGLVGRGDRSWSAAP